MSILLIISIISMRRLIIFHASINILDLFPREFLCLEYPQHFRFSNRQLNLINCLPIFDSPLGCSQEYFPRVGSAPVWAKKNPKTIDFTDPWGGRSPLPLNTSLIPRPEKLNTFQYFACQSSDIFLNL